jgi:hypothetical protein
MPRSKPSAPVKADRVSLPASSWRRIASQLGLDELPELCRVRVEVCLAHHLKVERAERERKDKAGAGHVEAAIARACKTLEELVALDSDIDAESLRILRPHAKVFIAAGRDRIRELLDMPRATAHHELLRLTCPVLRLIFQENAQPDFNTKARLRRFVFEALRAVGIATPGIDETRLERLDEYLDTRPRAPR